MAGRLVLQLEKIQETGHHKYVADVRADAPDDDLAALCDRRLAEGQEDAEAGTGDIGQLLTVENDGAARFFLQGFQRRGALLGRRCIQPADQFRGSHRALGRDVEFHIVICFLSW